MKKSLFYTAMGVCLAGNLNFLMAQDTESAVVTSTAPAAKELPSGSRQARPIQGTTIQATTWPHEDSDILPDPNVCWGRLNNGFRFAIVPNSNSTQRASVRLLIHAGSLLEKDGQEGSAHFLEHMAFNGTRHMQGSEAVEKFQRLGLSFGAHANASTEHHRTIYALDLPSADRHVMDQTLEWFRDVMDGLLLDPAEIEQERKVILSELDATSSGQYRRTIAIADFAFADMVWARRFPNGLRSSIEAADAESLRQYHETVYRPDNAVLVIVGDIDPEDAEELIQSHFESLRCAATQQDLPVSKLWETVKAANTIKEQSAPRCRVFVEPELKDNMVTIGVVASPATQRDSVESQTEKLKMYLGTLMLSKRLSELAEQDNSPVISCEASFTESMRLIEELSISATIPAGSVSEPLATLEQQVRRAVLFGFEDSEFESLKEQFEARFEGLADSAETRDNSSIATSLIESLSSQTVFMHPAQDQKLVKEMLATLTKEDCRSALANFWNSNAPYIFVSGPSLEPLGFESHELAAKQVLSAYEASLEVPIQFQKQTATQTFAYSDFGQTGLVVSRNEVDDLGITQVRFANNVRLNMKSTDFEKDTVNVEVRFGRGLQDAPASKPGLPILTQALLIEGGLGRHSFSQINEILVAGNSVLVFNVTDDCFVLQGTSTKKNAGLLMRAIAAYMTDAALRPATLRNLHSRLDSVYGGMERTPQGLENSVLLRFIRGGDRRFGFPLREDLEALTIDDVRQWIAEPMSRSTMEVSVVGDLDADSIIAAVAESLGALPEREASPATVTNDLSVKLPAADQSRQWTFTSDSPTGAAFLFWPTDDQNDAHRQRRIEIVREIFQDRLRRQVREDLGAVYTPSVASYSGEAFTGYSYLAAVMQTEAATIETVSQLAHKIGTEMQKVEITDDEFQRAMAPKLASLEAQLSDNSYWLNLLNRCQQRPERLDRARSFVTDYRAMTRDDIQSEARRIFSKTEPLVLKLAPVRPE